MPAKKKTAKKTTKKTTARKPKETYICVPCGREVTVSTEGLRVTRRMCCGEVMKPKKKGRC